MPRKNLKIREEAERAGLRLWQVAERYGLNDGNFSRLLRKELPSDLKEKIFQIITELEAENRGE